MYTNGLKDRFGSPLLSKREADELYVDKQNGSKAYDWTPNTDIKIQFSLANDYTTPVNGWLVINSNTTDDNEMWSLSVNDKQLFSSDQRGNLPIQILLSKNDVLSTDSTVNRRGYFIPCKSEGYDYRVTKTPYDIWANAVVEDENGNLSVQNLYVPDASTWYTETPVGVTSSIIRVENEVAYDVNNNLVCNIQSSEIVNGSNLFYYCDDLTSFDGDLSNLDNGYCMFYHTNLATFSADLSSLTSGGSMFEKCKNLTTFSSDLHSLTSGGAMFYDCTKFTSFIGDLSKLRYGYSMFYGTALSSFSSDSSGSPVNLSNLTDGSSMFYKTSLASFSGDLSNLTNGYQMFTHSLLGSFSGDLSNLTNGYGMFFATPLTSFDSNLSSLTNGEFMFISCSLNGDSVHNIAQTINNEVTNNPRLDLGVNSSILTNTQTKNDFGVIIYKGWNLWVNWQTNFDYIPWSSQKYNGCTTVDGVISVDSNYKTTDIVNGKWTEHLCDLEDGTNMFYQTSLASFNGDLSSLTNGNRMFSFTSLTSFSGDLSSLTNGNRMFSSTSLESFSGDLSSLVNGSGMFSSTSLASFSGDLSSLTDGYQMFFNCSSLTSFSGDLSSLTNGSNMFQNTKLTSFSGDSNGSPANLSSLTNGNCMFYYCSSLASFDGDLSSLTHGFQMFYNCSSLTSFDSNLSSLTNGYNMFHNTKFNTESIKGIADTIKDVTELTNSSYVNGTVYKQIDIGISNSSPTTEEQGYLNTIASKGWTVYVNGSAYTPTGVASVMTLDEDGNEVETPIPYYAKPIASDEEHAEYIDSDGNYFNIVGAQFIYGDDLSTYGMFTCEEDAALNMGLTKIDK